MRISLSLHSCFYVCKHRGVFRSTGIIIGWWNWRNIELIGIRNDSNSKPSNTFMSLPFWLNYKLLTGSQRNLVFVNLNYKLDFMYWRYEQKFLLFIEKRWGRWRDDDVGGVELAYFQVDLKQLCERASSRVQWK